MAYKEQITPPGTGHGLRYCAKQGVEGGKYRMQMRKHDWLQSEMRRLTQMILEALLHGASHYEVQHGRALETPWWHTMHLFKPVKT